MHRLLTALIAIVVVAGAASSASAAKIVFKGSAIVEAASTECGAAALARGKSTPFLFEAAFRPAGLGSNGPATNLQCTQAGREDTMEIYGFVGSLKSTFQPVDGLRVALGEATAVQNFSANVRLLEQQPSTLTNTTKFIFMRWQVRNFGNIAGCRVTLRAALVR